MAKYFFYLLVFFSGVFSHYIFSISYVSSSEILSVSRSLSHPLKTISLSENQSFFDGSQQAQLPQKTGEDVARNKDSREVLPIKSSKGVLFNDHQVLNQKSVEGQSSLEIQKSSNAENSKHNLLHPNITLEKKEIKKKIRIEQIKKEFERSLELENFHHAIWKSKDLYELTLDAKLLEKIHLIAKEAHLKSEAFLMEGDLLQASDYLESLAWGYEGAMKQKFKYDETIQIRLIELQGSQEFQDLLKERAYTRYKALKGDIKSYPPYWDVARMGILNRKLLKDPEYLQLLENNLDHLIRHYNFTGDYWQIENLTYYFRSSFPELTSDERFLKLIKEY